MFLEEARPPEGLRIYAIGDVHGRFDCLTEILDRIAADLERRPAHEHRIIFVGDYTDRGPDSRKVIELLSRRASEPEFVCLLGNHDDWLYNFMSEPELVGPSFLRWGGTETLQSYGVSVDLLRRTDRDLARELSRIMPDSHRQFLSRLDTHHEEGDFLFCHAGVRPGVPLNEQDRDDLIWIREEFLDHPGSFGKVVVHGHTPVFDIDIRRNRINIDTGAFQSGVLTCLVLEGDERRVMQTGSIRHDH